MQKVRGSLGTHNIDTQYCNSLVSLVGLAGIRVCPQTRPGGANLRLPTHPRKNACAHTESMAVDALVGALTSFLPDPNGPHGLYQQVSVATPFTTFT